MLYCGATPRALPERLFQLLLSLLESGGDVLDRAALATRVWGSDAVTDANLTQHIYMLREVLGETKGASRYIIAVPGRGYRFAAPVSKVPSDADGMMFQISEGYRRLETSDVAVLEQYCRGAYLLDRRTAPALRDAVSAFEAALSLDDVCVPALVGLARAWALLAEYWHVPTAHAMELARRSIDRAVELDSRSPMALATLSEVQLCGERDWTQARASLDAALTLDARLPFARNNAAWYYLYCSQFDDALRESREALLSEPSSLPLQLLHARVLFHSGDYSGAVSAISRILNTAPDFVFARQFLASAYLLNDQPERAIEEMSVSRADPPEDAVYRLPLQVCAFARIGNKAQAAKTYAKLRALSRKHYVSSWSLALGAANCGQEDEAIWLLRDASRQRDSALLLLPIFPLFHALERRSDFAELRRSCAA